MQDIEKFISYFNMRKSRNRWRLVALVVLVIMAIGALSRQSVPTSIKAKADHIARITLSGIILESREQTEKMQEIANNKSIKGVIVEIDSPGGTMTGGLSVYKNLREIAAKKPVVAVMKTIAASGGYLSALGADYILANEATLTGSIGVVMPLVDATELAAKIGIKNDAFASGTLKANTSPLDVRDIQDRQYLQNLVDTLNDTFYKYVKLRRPNMTDAQINYMKDGRAVVGVQAFNLNLIDAIGDMHTAQKWFQTKLELDPLLVEDYPLYEPEHWLQDALLGLLPAQIKTFFTYNTLPTGRAPLAMLQ